MLAVVALVAAVTLAAALGMWAQIGSEDRYLSAARKALEDPTNVAIAPPGASRVEIDARIVSNISYEELMSLSSHQILVIHGEVERTGADDTYPQQRVRLKREGRYAIELWMDPEALLPRLPSRGDEITLECDRMTTRDTFQIAGCRQARR